MTKTEPAYFIICSLPHSMCLSVTLTPHYLERCASEYTIKHLSEVPDFSKLQVTVSNGNQYYIKKTGQHCQLSLVFHGQHSKPNLEFVLAWLVFL